MTTDGHVIRYTDEGHFFAANYLNSNEFTIAMKKEISHKLGLGDFSNKSARKDILDKLSVLCEQDRSVKEMVFKQVLLKNKMWHSIRFSSNTIKEYPNLRNPYDLVIKRGEPTWYGPIEHPIDHSKWYVRPKFEPHYILAVDDKPQKVEIRWLIFARIDRNFLSLHWDNFSYTPDVSHVNQNMARFPYWLHVPSVFDEIANLLKCESHYINLLDLILHNLWDRYRYDNSYSWTDRNIRAEAGGVFLNAKAGMISDDENGNIDVTGIRGLASTIRLSLDIEFRKKSISLFPDPAIGAIADEVILGTLIREFGALSYEFMLKSKELNTALLKTHAYFGAKPNQPSIVDCFPHMRFIHDKKNDMDFLRFIMEHFDEKQAASSIPKTASMF